MLNLINFQYREWVRATLHNNRMIDNQDIRLEAAPDMTGHAGMKLLTILW